MHFSRSGDAIQAVRITGPARTLVKPDLGTPPDAAGHRMAEPA